MEDQVKRNALWDTVFLTVFFVINCTFWPFTHSIHQSIWSTIHTQFCRNQKTMQLWTQPLCTVHCKFYWHLDSGARLNWSILDLSLTEPRTTCWTNGQDLLFLQLCSRAYIFFIKNSGLRTFFMNKCPPIMAQMWETECVATGYMVNHNLSALIIDA